MIRLRPFSLILLGVVLFFSSCSGLNKVRTETHQYNLEYPPPRFTGLKPLPVVIKMAPISTAPIYDTSRILYRDRSFDLKSYAYHRWPANPGDLVQYFLLRDLRASELYRAVLPFSSRSPAPYIIEGSLDEFMEWDGDEGWQAVLSLSVTLIRRGERGGRRRIVMQRSYRSTEPCSRKNPLAVVEAMSRAMARTSSRINSDLYASLKDES